MRCQCAAAHFIYTQVSIRQLKQIHTATHPARARPIAMGLRVFMAILLPQGPVGPGFPLLVKTKERPGMFWPKRGERSLPRVVRDLLARHADAFGAGRGVAV